MRGRRRVPHDAPRPPMIRTAGLPVAAGVLLPSSTAMARAGTEKQPRAGLGSGYSAWASCCVSVVSQEAARSRGWTSTGPRRGGDVPRRFRQRAGCAGGASLAIGEGCFTQRRPARSAVQGNRGEPLATSSLLCAPEAGPCSRVVVDQRGRRVAASLAVLRQPGDTGQWWERCMHAPA